MEISKNKSSNLYQYSIFTARIFDKPNLYTLCYKDLDKPTKWWHKLFSEHIFKSSTWTSIAEDGSSAYGYKKPFITESIEKINNFMEWNIKKDNNEL